MGMELPEQADSSAERIVELNSINRIEDERVRAGSTLQYVRQLGEWYLGQGDHRPNIRQLQRMAGAITNPKNETTYPTSLTNAFYWGEILGYRARDLMSEDEWSYDAYPLFNTAMREHAKAAQLLFEEPVQHPRTGEWSVQELSHTARLQGIADMILGQLEEPDSECMPPAMEELIVSLSGELDPRPEDRWYMILGFRHVMSQVAEAPIGDDKAEISIEDRKALAKELKKEERVRKALQKQFLKLMDKEEIDDIQGRELIAIDSIREKLMESYADHMLAYGEYDETDEDQLDKLKNFLRQTLQSDFVDMEELEADDFLQIGGEAIYIVNNDDDETAIMSKLGTNEFLEGTPDSIAIVKTPNLQMMLGWQKNLIAIDQLWEDTNQLGVVMVLHDPVIVNNENEHIQVGQNRTVCVIMTNPNMTISKYLF